VALHADALGYYAWDGPTPGTVVETGRRLGPSRALHTFDAVALPDGAWWFVGSAWTGDDSRLDAAAGLLTRDEGRTWEHYTSPEMVGNSTRFERADVIDGLPAAYHPNEGWWVLRSGVLERIYRPDPPTLPDPFLDTPPLAEGTYLHRLVLGELQLVGDEGGNIWVRPIP